jgi:hypothetical protein
MFITTVCLSPQYVWNIAQYVWNIAQYVWNIVQYVWNIAQYVWNIAQYVWNIAQYVWNIAVVHDLSIDKTCKIHRQADLKSREPAHEKGSQALLPR